MKRLFTTLLSVSLAMIMLLSGCSSATVLSFNNAFNGGTEPYSEYWETLTYSVTSGEYKDLTRSDLISKDVVDYSINGTLKITFNSMHVKDIPEDVKSKTDIDLSGKLYHLSSVLSLNSTYTVNGEGGGDSLDEIQSEVIFLTKENSFAPIFSYVKQSYNVLYASNADKSLTFSTDRIESEFRTIYSKDKYTLTKTSGESQTNSTFDYDFRSLIDNTQLLFAIRNLPLEKDSSSSILTVAPSYGTATPLLIKNNEETTQNVNIKVNGTEISESLSIKNITFRVNDNKNTGTPQYVTIQKTQSENILYKSLMIEYAEPLICYGSYASMGALIYKLTSVDYAK